ncbi:HAMP domain-containing histidine kinase [Streptomyces sp. SID13666]|uniref:sensor histidine kinase n=1 Tax=Streptomyces TaxID=1883 RepID=UPI0013BEE0C2|nr:MULTISPECIES: HAMP domain-containing sensor histidine kinase [Streptomyces]MCZ4099567.1 HAMP domain-containing sensor histidine kinase [Streptomyces sp. H39-C1]NEA60154.1 HAMP domain-containing histidine kinase [Streptomyces sp. SID13666]NEA74247.1 HAMP domain-containing histidine kinase [Streptomyces sp. SID13588]QNA73979.1 HAMP domain-containing histidine kinase [Streptomyces sp. So13.3]
MAREPRPARGKVPFRRSLLGRLLFSFVLVATCSVAATTWLAVQTTSGSIQQEQSRYLANDALIYGKLAEYAATHANWDGIAPTVRQLAATTQRRIAVTTQDRRPVADSAPAGSPLPQTQSAALDPLHVDATMVPGATAGDIDPRAVGPFRLLPAERKQLHDLARRSVSCLADYMIAGEIADGPSGRPHIKVVGGDPSDVLDESCNGSRLAAPTATESSALADLNSRLKKCLTTENLPLLELNPDLTWGRTGAAAAQGPTPVPTPSAVRTPRAVPAPAVRDPKGGGITERKTADCVDTARRDQLREFVAPAAYLFVTDPSGATTPGFALSRSNTLRVAGVAALVLALAAAVTLLLAARLIRPLRALTDAAQRMRDGDDSARVTVATGDEIGRLSAAFNDMSQERQRLAEQRKAMVSDVAHELRTPVSNIRGWLEAVEDGIAEPDDALNSSLLEEALQLQHIIDDLQDLAAADAGTLRVHPEAVRLGDILEQVAAAHRARAASAGVALTVTPGDLGLQADPVRLRQAVGNLVSNAIRHTPPGGSVSLRGYTDDDRIVIDITDTGTGIAPDDLPHVFDRFWRAEKSRNRQTGGSGLGLAIVRQLAESHGGTATVASAGRGHGSTFSLRLGGGA